MIRLTDEPLDIGAAAAAVNDPFAGGVSFFAGTTRAEKSADGRDLLALDYEAYPEMAIRQLEAMEKSAREQWAILRVLIWHRTGRVKVGEPSVIIAVATAHRQEAFEASHWLIDQLKAKAAIWKREVWASGPSTWVHPNL